MALTATARVEAQVLARGYYGEFENRFSSYGAIKAFFDNAAGLLPVGQLRQIRNNQNARAIAFPLLTKENVTVITARSCTIAGGEPTSVKPTFTKITRGFEVKLYPKVFDNNDIALRDAYAQKIGDGLRAVMSNLDTYAVSQLEAGKSTDLQTVKLAGLTVASNTYQIDLAHRDRLYYYAPTILNKNDMAGRLINNIANTEAMELMLEYEDKGQANSVNTAAVLRGDLPSALGMRHYTSNRIVPGVGVLETHYFVPSGSIGVFTYNDSDAINNRKGPNMQAYIETDGVFGIPWDVVEEPICSDLSATYGPEFVRTFGTRYQFAADFAFLSAYSSDNSRANIKLNMMDA